MKQILIILGLFASASTFAQSPRIKLNQITKDTVKGSVLISNPADSGMVYSRDFYIAYGADTVLILYGDTLAATSGIISSVLSDGVTITGNGTTGNELKADTSIIATIKALNDSLATVSASTEADGVTITGAGTVADPLKVDTATVISTIQGLVDTLTARGYLTANQTITLSGDVTGSGTTAITATVVDDSHNHIISNVDNLQTELDSKLESEVDGSISNEGSLTVGAGTASTSVISSNTSGSTDVTLTAGSNITLSETGNNITIASTNGGTTYNNISETADTVYIDKFLNVDTSTLYVDATNNRVGIGTTSPSAKLDVNGKIELNDGGNSVFIGTNAGINDDGVSNNNIGIGYQPLYNNVSATGNIAIGYETLYFDSTGSNNIAIGYQSMKNHKSSNANVAIGYQSLLNNISGGSNVSLGYSLVNNTTGNRNIGIGSFALVDNTSGSNNVGIGYTALYHLSTGNNNQAYGYLAGRYIDGGSNLTNANSSLFLGNNTRASANGNSNEIVIGTNAIGNGSNSITIGGSSNSKVVLNGVGSTGGTNSALYITSGGELTTNSSDQRLKTNINSLDSELNTLMNLNPVKYNYYDDLENESIGFIAQELEIYYPNLVFTNPISNYKGVHYHLFAPILVKAIQEQQSIIETQEQKITDLETTIQSLITRIENLENK